MTIPASDPRASVVELQHDIAAAVEQVLASGRYVLGEQVEGFEREFAQHCGASHCVGVASGTDAVALALRASGVGPGDEVIVPAWTAVATWMAVSQIGATPKGVDVDEQTYTIDPAAVAAAVGARTRAIVAVHLFGHPADMDAIAPIAAEHGLTLIEDAAQAHGARLRGRPAGALARAAAFSFYPTKNLGAIGDGGAVTTADGALADRVRLLRAYGWRTRDVSQVKGVNSRLDELQAAILRVKLRRLDEWNSRRRALAERYDAALADDAGRTEVERLRVPAVAPWATHVWHQYVILAHERDALRRALADAGVGTLVHYDPLPHLTPAYRAEGWEPGSLPVAEGLVARAVSLPMYPQLTAAACDQVIAALRAALAG